MRDIILKSNLQNVCEKNNQFSVFGEITKVSCNSGRQASYKLSRRLFPLLFSSLEELCKNMSLNFEKQA